ncbi:MAG: metal ABC transporter permease [Acidobacteriaceae bacterium]
MHNMGNIYEIILALLFAVAAGLVGSFALMKRMILASDVISHVALPGIGLAFLFGFNPLLGGAATLFLGTLLIWQLQKTTGLAVDAMIGVVFAGSLAIGAAVTPKEDLVEALFGSYQTLSLPVFLMGAAVVLLIIFMLFRFKDQLLLSLFSPEMATATSIRLNRLNLYFLLVFSLTVLVGLRFMGAMLAGALVILPAATGRQLASHVSQFLLYSCIASIFAVAAGLLITFFFLPHSSPGPIIVIVSAIVFVMTLFRRTA